MQDNDFSLFKSAIQGVKPIKHDRAETGKPCLLYTSDAADE